MNTELLPYNPVILKWAREKYNYSLEDIAQKFNKPTTIINSWEDGTGSPTYVQLERLAYEIYKRPLAIFFFTESPKDTSGKELFRTLPEYEFKQMSPQFTYIIRKAQARQENLRELNEGNNVSNENLTNQFSISKNNTVEEVARKFRKYLGVTLEEQKTWMNADIALKHWRTIIEDNGIYIFKDAFKDDSFSGFCLYDDIFPIIYINNSKAKTRQIFTLFHELAHILFKTGGVDTRLDDYIDYLDAESKLIEIYCNKFAGEFLVPQKDFEDDIMGKNLDEEIFSDLATLYSVSREVILRKLLDMGKIERAYYLEKSEEWTEQAKESKKKNTKGIEGNYYNNIKAYLGKNYINLVFEKLYQNKISRKSAADYLDIKASQMQNLEIGYLKGTNV